MLLFREKVAADWLPRMKANLPAVLVDHAHLERKAATTALNLETFQAEFAQDDIRKMLKKLEHR